MWCSRVSWWNKRRGESNLHKAATPGMRCCLPFGELTLGWKQNYLQLFGNQNVIQEKDILILHAAAAGGKTQFNFLHFKTLMGNIFVSSFFLWVHILQERIQKVGSDPLKPLNWYVVYPCLSLRWKKPHWHFTSRWGETWAVFPRCQLKAASPLDFFYLLQYKIRGYTNVVTHALTLNNCATKIQSTN